MPLQIVSPVAGMAKPAGNHAISIKPATAGFTDYEVILSNIRLSIHVDDSGTFLDAGQVGGFARMEFVDFWRTLRW